MTVEEKLRGVNFCSRRCVSSRTNVRLLHISGIDRVLDFLQAVFSLIACTLYVIESYDRDLEMNLYVLAVELFIGCFFCLITVLRCFCQKIRENLFSLISV